MSDPILGWKIDEGDRAAVLAEDERRPSHASEPGVLARDRVELLEAVFARDACAIHLGHSAGADAV